MQKLIPKLPNAGDKCAPPRAGVSPATAVLAPRVFQHALNKDDNIGYLTWWVGTDQPYSDPLMQFLYDYPIADAAVTGPVPAGMIICYQTANQQIAFLDFNGFDAGKNCGIRYKGVQYDRDSAGNLCTYRNSDPGTTSTLLIIG